ncbi:MAG: hypothetical protein ACRDAU_11950 [Clostridium sp.]
MNKKHEINLILGIGMQDKKKTIEAIKSILDEEVMDYSKTKFYSNVEAINAGMKGNYKKILKEMILNNKELDFVREESKFKFLVEEL